MAHAAADKQPAAGTCMLTFLDLMVDQVVEAVYVLLDQASHFEEGR